MSDPAPDTPPPTTQKFGRSFLTQTRRRIGLFASKLRAGRILDAGDANPYRLKRIYTLRTMVVALVLALTVYIALVWFTSDNVVRQVEKADVLLQILEESPLYVMPISDGDAINDLAIVTWLRELGLVALDEPIGSVFQDERLSLLIGALRDGDRCSTNTERAALQMPTVIRLVKLATYVASDCSGQNGSAAIDLVAASLVKEAAGLSECEYTFRMAPLPFDCLGWFWGNRTLSGSGLIRQVFMESSVYIVTDDPDDPDDPDAAGAEIIRQLSSLATNGVGTAGVNDDQLRALKDFSIAVLAAIDGEDTVVAAKRWLSIVRGMEQLAIIFISFALLGLMYLRLQNHRLHRSSFASARRLVAPIVVSTPIDSKKGFDKRLSALSSASIHLNSPAIRDLMARAMNELKVRVSHDIDGGQTDREADDMLTKLDLARTYIDWGVITLPAFGFVGTVHGILDALQGVGGLGQGDAAARMSTLIDVSGSLGLAFATTLMALLAMIAISFIDAAQFRSEKTLIVEARDYFETAMV